MKFEIVPGIPEVDKFLNDLSNKCKTIPFKLKSIPSCKAKLSIPFTQL